MQPLTLSGDTPVVCYNFNWSLPIGPRDLDWQPCSCSLSNKHKLLETNSDYILWIQIDKTLFEIDENMFLDILYVPPAQSHFLNDDEYFNLESEITSMCAQSSYICQTGDMNARTSTLCDFITADSFIADLMDFDEDTFLYYNQAEQLKTLNINQQRTSCDKKTNNNGHKLIEICINNNLFILNGRCGHDSTEGKFTFRDQSVYRLYYLFIQLLKASFRF